MKPVYSVLITVVPPMAAAIVVTVFISASVSAGESKKGEMPLYVFCGTGDHLWVRQREPVDSPATIDAMMEWMSKTYGIKRLYWRGGQTMMWDKHFKIGKEKPLQYDWVTWKHHLYNDLKINEAAVSAAKRNGMEVFLYTGLFEFGVQPDIGIVGPYLFEDELRIEHPEWCPVDRWGQRRCPGPISFCYPEARKLVIRRYVDNLESYGYDGINFYTYVENCGIRYEDEFGFNQPIVDEFNKEYPNVDLRKDELTASQKEHWYRCRGRFVTEFLRELHAALAARHKKMSMILDAKQPDYAQPWWSKEIAGTGRVRMDWRTWVKEGLVDEIWVQLGPVKDQRKTLDLLLEECKGTPVKLTVRAVDPFDAGWGKYVASGVTPIAVITWARNGIERFALEPTSVDTLSHPDWRLRLQTLTDIEAGQIKADSASIAALVNDSHVLVRRRVMMAIGTLKAADQVAILEQGLLDGESSVRLAAAGSLAKVNRPQSVAKVMAALESYHYFQMKEACIEALAAMKQEALPQLMAGMKSSSVAVREVSIRALCKAGADGFDQHVYAALRTTILDQTEDARLRYYAVDGMVGLRNTLPATSQVQLANDLTKMTGDDSPTVVRLHAAWGLGHMHGLLTSELRKNVVQMLADGFAEYGDDSRRPDAAFGWRVFGNALLQYHKPGRDRLEQMRAQTEDRWLAWIAYEVVHLPHRYCTIKQIEEHDAIVTHKKYAPPFPGYRKW